MAEGESHKPISITENYLLLVEGKDDENFFWKFIHEKLGEDAAKKIQVLSYNGKDNLSSTMQTLLPLINSRSNFKAVAVIRDADQNATEAFQSVFDMLQRQSLNPSSAHAQISASRPAVGIFIMPDGESPGELETLCRRSCADDKKSACVESYIQCLRDKEVLENSKEDKTFAHSYIASTRRPEVSFGVSALENVWDFNSTVFDSLTDFIEKFSKI